MIFQCNPFALFCLLFDAFIVGFAVRGSVNPNDTIPTIVFFFAVIIVLLSFSSLAKTEWK